MSNNLLFITMVAMTLFNVSAYVFVMIRFTEIQNQIKDIADNQFDAEEVMKVFNQKYNRPIITQDRADIKELVYEDRIPWEVYKRMENDKELHTKLAGQISKYYADMIIPYIDIAITSDYFRNDEVVKARLRVVGK